MSYELELRALSFEPAQSPRLGAHGSKLTAQGSLVTNPQSQAHPLNTKDLDDRGTFITSLPVLNMCKRQFAHIAFRSSTRIRRYDTSARADPSRTLVGFHADWRFLMGRSVEVRRAPECAAPSPGSRNGHRPNAV